VELPSNRRRDPQHVRGCLESSDDDSEAEDIVQQALGAPPDELAIYMDMKLSVGAMEDPQLWWLAHASAFPQLHLMALDYLSIPASSVPSERANSVAAMLWEHRATLNDDTFAMEMCIASWAQLGIKYK
jgi:hypothetical protein